jgi:hypothetical protein
MSFDSAVFSDVRRLKSEDLTARVDQLASRERLLICDFLVYLAELDRRELHLELGFPSLFAYCTEHLRFSKASTFRRTTAARLVRSFPEIIGYLRSGQLCLTTLCELRKVLEPESCTEILEQAAGKTQQQVQQLVASLRPQPPPKDIIRKLPARAQKNAQHPSAEPTDQANSQAAAPPAAASEQAELVPDRKSYPQATIKPVSSDRHVVRIVVDTAFLEELEKVKQALSHKVPSGRPAEVLRECIRITLAVHDKKTRGSGRRRKTTRRDPASGDEQTSTRHVPIAVEREVRDRDGGACAFIGKGGKRCGSRHQVQLHHVIPFALGGPTTASNLELRCGPHNRYQARLDFGAEHMARYCGSAPDPLPR